MITEIVYKNRDNSNDLVLKADGVAIDLSGVTKMDLVFSGQDSISSSGNPGFFDWSQGDGKLVLTLGDIDFFIVDQKYIADLIVYDASNQDGVDWGDIGFFIQ